MAEAENVLEMRAMSRVGSTLNGKYSLERLLGVGGMASVYEAVHRNGKRFAVKVLHAEVSINEDMRQRFLREGYVANKVEHPGAVAVLDDDVTDDGDAFLVMELLEGEPVDAFALRLGGRLPLRAVLCLAEQLLDVLAAADAKHIVHRDIKPSNIFLTRQGQLKVLDFGVARLRGEGAGTTTHTGMTLGTPAYMAPEQALGRASEVDGQSDLWAVGATMFGLLAGRIVHEAQSAQEQMVLAATKPPQSLGEVAPDVPRAVVAIVDKALSFTKKGRWASASAMRDAVRAAHVEMFGEQATGVTLAAMISQVRVSLRPMTEPSDPMAPTALAEAVNEPGASVPPNATSLVGTAARVTTAPRARALRFLAASTALVAIGVGVGAVLTRRASGVGDAASGQAVASAPSAAIAPIPSATPSPSTTPELPAPSATATATASASAPDAAARPVLPAIPRPSAKPSATAHDSFDHQ